MSSRDSSSSRGTVVHLLRQEDGTFPVTPTKNEEGVKRSPTPNGYDTTPLPDLQRRRGRRNVANGTFRPLSIFTKSMLAPFDQNFEKAFEVLKTDSPDRLKVARSILSPRREDTYATETKQRLTGDDLNFQQKPHNEASQDNQYTANRQNQPRGQVQNSKTVTPNRPILDASMLRQRLTRDFDMDLMTALKETSPEKDLEARVSGDFATLCELPVPDPSEHPAFASHPFEVKTEAPLLFTSTSVEDIRAYKPKGYHNVGCPSNVGRQSVERKKSLFGLGLSTPSSAKSRNAFNHPEDLPFPTFLSSSYAESTRSSIKDISPTAADLHQARESVGIDRSGGVRKFSDLFRRKEIQERNDPHSPVWSPRSSLDTPNLDRQDLEKYLRRTTFTPTFKFDPYSPYPRHPNTGRGWKSRNLKCTTCSLVDCAVCHRVCCAYRAAVLALETHSEGTLGRPLALQRIQEITKLYPYGRESPTFLQCTAGTVGEKMGCGRMVCPDCCSICPDDACADTVCRRCKPAMWEECDWHKDGMLSAEKSQD